MPRPLRKDYTIEDIVAAFYDCYGRVSDVAKKLGCSRQAIYENLEIYPELQEAKKKASKRFNDAAIETAENVLEKVMAMTDEDAGLASRNAQFILKYAKNSPYFFDKTDNAAEQEREYATRFATDVERRVASAQPKPEAVPSDPGVDSST